MNSPWGHVQSQKTIAPGITWVSTASHGGYLLSPDRTKELESLLPGAKSWAGPGAYEEDCDWCLVVLAYPHHFNRQDIALAVECAMAHHKEVRIADTDNGPFVIGIFNEFMAESATKWHVGGMHSVGPEYPRTCWNAHFTRGSISKWIIVTEYPKILYYSDTELDAITYKPTAELTPA